MATKKTTLSVEELYALETELNGTAQMPGLLSQRLSLVQKYHMTSLAKIASEEKVNFDKLRNELIMTLGEKGADDTVQIPTMVPEDPKKKSSKMIRNPNLTDFSTQLQALLSIQKEVEHYEFDLNDFSAVQTEGNYPVFYKILGLE